MAYVNESSQTGYGNEPGEVVEKRDFRKLETVQPIFQAAQIEPIHFLGGGMFGCVWKAKYKNQIIAVKVQESGPLTSSAKEFSLMRGVQHPGVIKLIDFFPESGLLVMEFAKNGTLQSFLEKQTQQLSLSLRFHFLDQLCEAMNYLHDVKKIYHRDLRAVNVLLDEMNNIKITDFGIALIHGVQISEKYSTLTYVGKNIYGLAKKMDPVVQDIRFFGIIMLKLLHFGNKAATCGESELDQEFPENVEGIYRELVQFCIYPVTESPKFLNFWIIFILLKLARKELKVKPYTVEAKRPSLTPKDQTELFEKIKSTNGLVRSKALEKLKTFNLEELDPNTSTKIQETLSNLVGDSYWNVQLLAIQILGQSFLKDSRKDLERAQKFSDRLLSTFATNILNGTDPFPEIQQWVTHAATEETLVNNKVNIIEYMLISISSTQNTEIRRRSATRIGDETNFDDFLNFFKSFKPSESEIQREKIREHVRSIAKTEPSEVAVSSNYLKQMQFGIFTPNFKKEILESLIAHMKSGPIALKLLAIELLRSYNPEEQSDWLSKALVEQISQASEESIEYTTNGWNYQIQVLHALLAAGVPSSIPTDHILSNLIYSLDKKNSSEASKLLLSFIPKDHPKTKDILKMAISKLESSSLSDEFMVSLVRLVIFYSGAEKQDAIQFLEKLQPKLQGKHEILLELGVAFFTLSGLNNEKGTAIILSHLKSSNSEIILKTLSVISQLVLLDSQPIFEAVQNLFKASNDWNVRAAIARLYGSFQHDRDIVFKIVENLMKALEREKDRNVKMQVLDALKVLGARGKINEEQKSIITTKFKEEQDQVLLQPFQQLVNQLTN